jgi:hypothetical protein
MLVSIHFVIENLGFARLSLGDEELVEDVQDILANILQFGLDLLAIFADDRNMLIGAFRFLFLFDGGNNPPRSTPSANHVLVCHGEQVALINGEFTI